MLTKIDRINELFEEYCLKTNGNESDIKTIKRLLGGLNLNNLMSLAEIHAAILSIEGINIFYGQGTQFLSMAGTLEYLKQPMLVDYFTEIAKTGLPELAQPESAILESNIPLSTKRHRFADVLIQAHAILCQILKKTYLNANGIELGNGISYTDQKIANSPFLKQIPTDNEEKQAPTTNIVVDMHRANVNLDEIQGTTFRQWQNNEPITEQQARQVIEHFTRDIIEVPGSQAHRIYYFGGQHLLGTLLKEFLNTTKIELDGAKTSLKGSIAPKGQINITEESEIISISVNLKIFTYQDNNDHFYALAADGASLVQLTEDDYAIIRDRVNKRETNGEYDYHTPKVNQTSGIPKVSKNESNFGYGRSPKKQPIEIELIEIGKDIPQKTYHIAPLAEVNAKFELQQSKGTEHYYFKTTEYSVNYSSDNKCSTNPKNIQVYAASGNYSPTFHKPAPGRFNAPGEQRDVTAEKTCSIM